MYFDQREFDIKFEWGLQGIAVLAPYCDVFIIVDVLSFTTCVDIVIEKGGIVIPYRWKDDSVVEFARAKNAIPASSRDRFDGRFSLSPTSLQSAPAGTKLVLPSPNGSTLSLATGVAPTFAGCLRNASAVASAAAKIGKRIGVIGAGEKWNDGSLRPSFEDLIGAGAIIAMLSGKHSPEAIAAASSYHAFSGTLVDSLLACGSGKELRGRHYENDVIIAAQANASETAPILVDGEFVPFNTSLDTVAPRRSA